MFVKRVGKGNVRGSNFIKYYMFFKLLLVNIFSYGIILLFLCFVCRNLYVMKYFGK